MLEKSLLDKRKLIISEDIIKLGKDAVLVTSSSKDVINYNQDEFYQIKDKEIYTKEGTNLGLVKDIRINEETGDIECFEISNGIISDIINGRVILPLIGKISFLDDCILVENEAFQEVITTKQLMEV